MKKSEETKAEKCFSTDYAVLKTIPICIILRSTST